MMEFISVIIENSIDLIFYLCDFFLCFTTWQNSVFLLSLLVSNQSNSGVYDRLIQD